MRTARDLSGQTFSHWTAVRPGPPSKHGPTTVVKCRCGRRATVQNGSLVSGRSTQCRTCGSREDLTGQRIAQMEVLSMAPVGNWSVRCLWCARRYVISYHQLVSWRANPPRPKCAHLLVAS